jgi:phospholipase/carboxylesterase
MSRAMASLTIDERRIGPLTVRCTGGTDGKGGGDGPAIVLNHGFGAPGDDLVALASSIEVGPLAGKLRWFFPQAHIICDYGGGAFGHAWWPIDMRRLQPGIPDRERLRAMEETPYGLDVARSHLEATLAELDLDPKRTILGGFSQGGMLATEIQIHRAEPYAGLAILSGALLSVDRWNPAIAERGKGLRVFQSHGRQDPIIVFAAAAALRNLLQAYGADLEFVEFAGGHEIPRVVLQGLGRLVQRVLVAG